MSRASKGLTEEDRILWSLVAHSAKPLKGKPRVAQAEPRPAKSAEPSVTPPKSAATLPQPPAAAKKQHVFHAFDGQTREKLGKGKLPIEGRVDLHGMTQETAHALLLSFLRRAHETGVRYVLVITGKGASFGSEGVLRRAVPAWLGTPPFRALVSGHDDALRHHGGSGALYIRLRKPGPMSGPGR